MQGAFVEPTVRPRTAVHAETCNYHVALQVAAHKTLREYQIKMNRI